MKAASPGHQRHIDPPSEAIRRAGCIGDMERLAGIPPRTEDRTAFWLPFSHVPGASALDAGTAELKRRIIASANDAHQQRHHRKGKKSVRS